MKYHTPVTQNVSSEIPTFMVHNNELVMPSNVFSKQQYPNLPSDMVKVTGINGQQILIPMSKLSSKDI